jgi:hypothetical protein
MQLQEQTTENNSVELLLAQLIKNIRVFIQPKCSLPCSQNIAIGPCPDQFNPLNASTKCFFWYMSPVYALKKRHFAFHSADTLEYFELKKVSIHRSIDRSMTQRIMRLDER